VIIGTGEKKGLVTSSRLPAGKVVKVHNGRGDVENRIKEGKNTFNGSRPTKPG
jgi:hypothetical protein